MPRAANATQQTHTTPTKPPLPKGWQWLRFDQIAVNVSDRIDDPKKADVEHYVGLEHLDSDSLKIRRWGTPDDVEAQKLRFRSGDIIFGKRRAYQRKVGVAEFAGICSAHAFVFRGNSDYIVPELLPFFMQTTAFSERAVAISKGSLSPTINWGDLARQEFALPSDLAEQRRIAELLAASDEAVEGWRTVEENLLQAKLSAVSDELFKHKDQEHSLADVLVGPIESGWSQSPVDDETGHFILALNALSRNGYVTGQLKNATPTPAVLDCRLKKGDFLMSRSNTRELVGLVGIFSEERNDVSFPDTMMRLPLNRSRVVPEYLELVLLSESGRRFMRAIASGTSDSMKKINRQGLGKFRFWLPSPEEQKGLLQRIGQFDACLREVRQQIERLRLAKLGLLSSLLTTPAVST